MQKNNITRTMDNITRTVEEQARELQRSYTRAYRQMHPEKVKEWNRTYWLRKAQKQSADSTSGSERKD